MQGQTARAHAFFLRSHLSHKLHQQCSLPEGTPTGTPTESPTAQPTKSPKPTEAPITSAPTANPTKNPTPAPTVPQPTNAPITSPPTPPVSTLSCSEGAGTSSIDMFAYMDDITHTVSNDPYVLSVLASGGAAGDGSFVVTESQAYGVLAAALAIVSLNEGDPKYQDTLNKFEGYFNGWKQMCIASLPLSTCQATKYCDG